MKQRDLMISAITAAALLAFSGCGGGGDAAPSVKSTSVFEVNGGDGATGGESSEEIYVEARSLQYIQEEKSISIEVDRGDLAIRRSGIADTSFDLPQHTEVLGAAPAIIESDTIVGVGLPDTTTQLVSNVSTLYYIDDRCLKIDYLQDGDTSNDYCLTGLKVKEGVELVLEGNYDNYVSLEFSDDVIIDGVLRSVRSLSQEALVETVGVHLQTERWIVVGESGKIDVKGAAIDSWDRGIELKIDHSESSSNPEDWQDKGILIAGTLDASGMDGEESGKSGKTIRLYLYRNGSIYVSGSIHSDGGQGAYEGGDGAEISLYSYGAIYVSGVLSAVGGDAQERGGDGGYVEIETVSDSAGSTREILFNGSIYASGGASTGGEGGDISVGKTSYIGGDGGEIVLHPSRDIVKFATAGTLQADGGSSVSGHGGNGGSIDILCDAENKVTLKISSNILANGGDTPVGEGGSPGFVHIGYSQENDNAGGVELLGYGSIEFMGGHGVYSAGRGGEMDISMKSSIDMNNTFVNEADLYGSGGNAVLSQSVEVAGGRGGDGGTLVLEVFNLTSFSNSGGIYLPGGDSWGEAPNSNGGSIFYRFSEEMDVNLTDFDLNLDPGSGGEGGEGMPGEILPISG